MDNHRNQRVSAALRDELGELIAYELQDPRISDTIVTEVVVSPDMRRAQVRLQIDQGKAAQQDIIRALEGARHFLRRQLAERLNIFRVPELHFEADVEPTVASRMEQLRRRIRRGRPRDAQDQTA